LARLGQGLCRTPEEFQAWSQNLGHEQVLTTFVSYGEVAASRQAAIIRGLSNPNGGNVQLVDLAQQIMQVPSARRLNVHRSNSCVIAQGNSRYVPEVDGDRLRSPG
jgi:hypothetical protein